MKYLIFLVLAMSCTKATLFAQEDEVIYCPAKPYSLTELYEVQTGPSTPYARFRFEFEKHNSMYIDLVQIKQLDSIPNVDSLFRIIWNDLQQICDSLNDPLLTRRITGGVGFAARSYRIAQHPQVPEAYRVKDGEIIQLKVTQDTLRIQLTTRETLKNPRPNEIAWRPYSVMLLLNHISELPTLLDSGKLSKALALVREDVEAHPRSKNELDRRYRGSYDVVNGRVVSSVKTSNTSYLPKKFSVELPNYQVGIQFINGSWAPSTGLGIELVRRSRKLDEFSEQDDEEGFRLIWEPYFFFDRDSAKHFGVSRNDFITFRWHITQKSKYAEKETRFRQTASLGYLLGRRGDYFQQNTFKFSITALQTKSIFLEPEFVFNKLFKNFSPSLKLLYFFGED